jgi:hypothetical protein
MVCFAKPGLTEDGRTIVNMLYVWYLTLDKVNPMHKGRKNRNKNPILSERMTAGVQLQKQISGCEHKLHNDGHASVSGSLNIGKSVSLPKGTAMKEIFYQWM